MLNKINKPLMEAYQFNITVNLSISHLKYEGLFSIVNILCYLNLIITMLNNLNNH